MSENVPIGADYDSRAPWNIEEEKETKEITVLVTESLSFLTTIFVPEDYTNKQLKSLVEKSTMLPSDYCSRHNLKCTIEDFDVTKI